MTITLFLSSALLCVGQTCSPVLVGKDTPKGEFVLYQRLVSDPLYAGSVLQFKETEHYLYAIHRVWRGKPQEQRDKRIQSTDVSKRFITSGCINVTEELYEKLLDCCQNQKLRIVD